MCFTIPVELTDLIHRAFFFMWVMVIVLLILFALLDVLKIITSSDERETHMRQRLLTRRVIAAICIFLLVYIVQFIFNLLNIPEATEAVACARDIILGH